MNRIFCAAIAATLLLTSCHDSLEDRAEKEAKKYTERYCPTPVRDNQRTDSLTFDRKTHTYNYYYTLVGPADNPDAINQNKAKLTKMLVQGVKMIRECRPTRRLVLSFISFTVLNLQVRYC